MASYKTIPALGRPFDLGMLYDRRSESLILGKTLWSLDHLNEAVNTVTKPYTNSEVFAEDTIDDKSSALGVEASLKLSFLGGLVTVEGAAKYLDDRKTSSHQSRVVLKYETTTKLRQLTMEHLGRGNVQYPEVFDQDIATDVVVGIVYGAKAFLIFDKEVSKDESLKDVHGNMQVLVKALPGISIDGKGSVDISEDQKKNTEKMSCKMYGDFRTEESPTNYEEAVRVYKQLPSLIGENGENAVAVTVYLCPLSEIDSKGSRMVREISSNFVSKTCDVQEHLQCVEAECNDLMREEICSCFQRIKNHLSFFRNNIAQYKTFLQKKFIPLLPSIRGGGAEESELGDILLQKERSPFSRSCIDAWMQEKKSEMKALQRIIGSLKETPFVSPEDVDNEAFDLSNEHVVCCTFKIAAEEDAHIVSMNDYLGNDVPELKRSKSQWINDKSVLKKIRESLKHFVDLKTANEENSAVKFLATEERISADFEGSLGAFLYLYENMQLNNEDFKSSPKLNKPDVKNVRHDSVELQWSDSVSDKKSIGSYKVQYKPKAASDWMFQEAECIDDKKQMVTLSGLQPATSYLFRVCAVGQIVVSQYSDTLTATTKPTSPPGKPHLITATANTISIAFTKPDHVGEGIRIETYKIEWRTYKDGRLTGEDHREIEDASLTYTVKDLQKGTSYDFRIMAICGNAGQSEASDFSDSLQTTVPPTRFDTSKILGQCDLQEAPKDGAPAVYTLPLSLVYEDSESQLRKFEINLEEEKAHPLGTTSEARSPIAGPSEKVIMVVGSTGSGKTTTLNGMINHILGVQWKDDFRIKIIHELSSNQGVESIGDQTSSQTQFVSCYTLPYHKGFKVPYTLTIVDTPGFGDTRGIEHDKVITEQIRTFFNTKGSAGIDHVDAICFMAQAGNPRLTPTQQYVFDRILSMFGKDIKKNIFVLFTFADGQKPQALPAMLKAEILERDSNYFKFNNSALFVDNSGEDDEENFDRMFWKMGIKSFEKFFTGLAQTEARSLVLTKQVLDERAQLEVRLSGLQQKINCGINTLSRLEQEQRIFNQHSADINANRNFKYPVKQEKRIQVRLNTGTFTTNCLTCNYTCHYPCAIPRDENKDGCAAMTNGECVECPNRCHWSNHVNDQYRYDTEIEEVMKEFDEIKDKYDTALQGHNKAEGIIKKLQQEFDQTKHIVLNFVAEMQRGLQKLSEIALKKDPLQQVDYLDLLIESEKSQAKPGWKDRVKSLQSTRDAAVQINRLAKSGYDPWKDYRENEETRKFFQEKTANASLWSRGFEAVKSAFK